MAMKAKQASPLFIPPYTPDYNPIEIVFGHIKRMYKSDRTDVDSEKKIENAIRSLTACHLASAFDFSYHRVLNAKT